MFSFKNLTKGLFIKVVAIFSLSLFGSGCKPEEGSACSSEKRDPPPPSAKKQEPDPFEKHGPPVPINEKLLGTSCIPPKNKCGGKWITYYDGVNMVCYAYSLDSCSGGYAGLARAEDVWPNLTLLVGNSPSYGPEVQSDFWAYLPIHHLYQGVFFC